MTGLLGSLFGVAVTDTNGGSTSPNYIHPENELPEKFRPSILNYKTEGPDRDLYRKVKKAFTPQKLSLLWGLWETERERSYSGTGGKSHIRRYDEVKGWIIKVERTDFDFGSDANIYRVRKAEKVAKIIEKYSLEQWVTVPKKHLFYITEKKTWAVVAEKLDVTECKRPDKIPVTPQQARAVAIIALEASMVDLHGGNIAFDGRGRVALLDTEPTTRKNIKAIKEWKLVKWKLLDISTVKFYLGLMGTNILKGFATNRLAKKAITEVQRSYVGHFLLKTALKIATCALGIFLLSYCPYLFVTVPLQTVLGAKITILALQCLPFLFFLSGVDHRQHRHQLDHFTLARA